MKKYCLTNCAKEKLSKVRKALIELTTAFLFAVVVILIFTMLSFILGFIGQGLWVAFMGPLTPLPSIYFIEFGSTIFLLSLIAATTCFLIYKGLEALYVMIRTLVTNTSVKKDNWGEEITCHIFEECIEEHEEPREDENI